MNGIRDFVNLQGWAPWDIRNQEGLLRHLVLRTGERTGDCMVNLVTYGAPNDRIDAFADFLRDDFPEVTTYVHTNHTGKSQNPEGEEQIVFGPGVIYDEIGDYRFEINPSAFFQTNTLQAERLYEVTRDLERLRDVYRVDAVEPVDMFPHTPHVETVARLTSEG